MTPVQFEVRQDQLSTFRLRTLPEEPLLPGQVRVGIEHFAYTANNITYAAFGEAMSYWRFFPVPPDADGTTWGCIPVWGFGRVVESQHPQVAVGERLYGYWPMASHAVLTPARPSAAGLSDGAPHRAGLHAVYNQYVRCSADPFYTPDSEPIQALLRPLFTTAWLIDDFLVDNRYFGTTAGGARAVMLLSSASSKTAWATAALLAQRPEIEVVGLTAPANRAFCERLGVYHRVLAYDELDELPAETPCVYVDFAGSAPLRRAVHGRLARLAYSCAVGGTHVDALRGAGRDLAGPAPVLFFAPAQVKKRQADWGAAVLGERLVAAWHALRVRATGAAPAWLAVQRHQGPQAVAAAHAQVLCGRSDPQVGHLLSLAP
jgi:hypothetical protein